MQTVDFPESISFLQTCLFQIGDYSYDSRFVRYSTYVLDYSNKKEERTVLLEYDISINPLKEKDTIYKWSTIGSNYSLAGFEITLKRHTKEFIIEYYLTSGLFVIVSWVRYMSKLIKFKTTNFSRMQRSSLLSS